MIAFMTRPFLLMNDPNWGDLCRSNSTRQNGIDDPIQRFRLREA
jgi:hypothetical protein